MSENLKIVNPKDSNTEISWLVGLYFMILGHVGLAVLKEEEDYWGRKVRAHRVGWGLSCSLASSALQDQKVEVLNFTVLCLH